MTDFDVVMIGNFAKDILIVDGIEEIASGGGVYYGSVVIKRLGARVAVVTRLHPDDFPRLGELRSEGIEVFATPAGGTSGIANFYQSSNMETRVCKPIGFGGKYNLSEIPDINTKVIILSPLYAGEVDLPLLQELSKRAPVGMDTQGFVRVPVEDDLVLQPWPDMIEGLKCVTYLKVDKAEAEYLTGLSDLHEAMIKLHSLGPKEIVLTQSSGVTVFANGIFYNAPFIPRSLVGRTGRGDTCFSAYIAKRLTGSAETACGWAGVVTSLKLEIPGPWKGTIADVEAVIRK
ncbi:MAG: PfkB family carbohydrate kinase [Chloroflexota bacterium]